MLESLTSFFIQLDFECHRLVNGTRLLCSDIAPVPSSNECIQKVEFQYIVTNDCLQPGCTDAFITNLEVQRDGNTTNLTALIPSHLVPPGNNVTAVEPFSLNFCQTRQFNVTSSVLARTTNTTTQAFCAADNVTKVKVQNANAVKSDAYAIDGLVTVWSRIGMYLFLAAVAGVMLIQDMFTVDGDVFLSFYPLEAFVEAHKLLYTCTTFDSASYMLFNFQD